MVNFSDTAGGAAARLCVAFHCSLWLLFRVPPQLTNAACCAAWHPIDQASWPLEDKQAARAFLAFQALPAEDAVHDTGSEYARGRRAVAAGSTSPAVFDGGGDGGVIAQYLPFLFVKDYKTASEALFETLFRFVKGVCPNGKLTNLDDYCATGKLGHGGAEVCVRVVPAAVCECSMRSRVWMPCCALRTLHAQTSDAHLLCLQESSCVWPRGWWSFDRCPPIVVCVVAPTGVVTDSAAVD